MSTQINSYVILGVCLDYDEFNMHIESLCEGDEWEAYETFVDPYCDNPFMVEVKSHNGLTMLFDGRDGNYVIIGKVLKKTGNHEWFYEPFVTDFRKFEEHATEVKKNIFEEFGISRDVKLIVNTHLR